MKNVIIIGAGPAGIAAAYNLLKTDANIKVTIFEASPNVGGMSRSFDLWGQRVDLGPHRFFSTNDKVNHFFEEVLQDDYVYVNRKTRIYYNNRFFDYPLKFFNVIKNLSIFNIIGVLYYYFLQQLFPLKQPRNFEEWVINRFGKKLYNIFFKNYTEKLWGIPGTKIHLDWAAQRIKGLSLYQAILSALKNNKGNKHATLVDVFKYPKEGAGLLYEKAAKFVTEHGGVIHTNTAVKKIIIENGVCTGVTTTSDEDHFSDVVISSMPITYLLKGIANKPEIVTKSADALYFRNTILVYLEINTTSLFKDNWIYIHSPDVDHGRITNFSNWNSPINDHSENTILCMEFWAFDADELWHASDDNIAEKAIKELEQIKLVSSVDLVQKTKVIRVPKCYPVYEMNYKEHLDHIENYLDTIQNLIPIGRYGAFKYNNQDHSILMGILAAEMIGFGKNVNLWDINTDSDYQEDGELNVKDVLVD